MREKFRVEPPKSTDEPEVSRVVLHNLLVKLWGRGRGYRGLFEPQSDLKPNISALMEAARSDLSERKFTSIEKVKLMFKREGGV